MVEDILNLDFYSGEDLYSDGDIEDELLDIVSKQDQYETVLERDNRWPILYHLSAVRHNLLEWYEMEEGATVLEIGAGCGALTGILCQKAKHVTCIELSKKRSLINATRNYRYGNLEIVVGNFEDIQLAEQYDYVTLIGVLEYAPSYIQARKPFASMLKRVRNYLKPGGKLIIAIENKYGLKYFAGATEDHTGILYNGINNYEHTRHVRTFTKMELQQLLCKNGFPTMEFYYPMPDYKLPTVVYSDAYLPTKGELRNITNVYDRERFCLFQEEVVYDQLCQDGMIDYFANSFLVFAQPDGEGGEYE